MHIPQRKVVFLIHTKSRTFAYSAPTVYTSAYPLASIVAVTPQQGMKERLSPWKSPGARSMSG
ncbi:hypothetical protein [Chryseobacterium taeanense]|uniref:hypothetical protein n=1 Tax=Chryseobacterium taeanense TaxID=311334 RepID=UPI000B7F64DD|nr:hypothetical protein [Chryseobacterium taeanense]